MAPRYPIRSAATRADSAELGWVRPVESASQPVTLLGGLGEPAFAADVGRD
jgi:hypothetical protein